MRTRARDASDRIKSLLDRVKNEDLPEPEERDTDYFNVCWHKRMKHWRVRVCYREHCFYKTFHDEHVAAWVADCVGLLMKGVDAFSVNVMTEARVGCQAMFNYDWTKGIPPCPDPSITTMTVYEWLIEKEIPSQFKPSDLSK